MKDSARLLCCSLLIFSGPLEHLQIDGTSCHELSVLLKGNSGHIRKANIPDFHTSIVCCKIPSFCTVAEACLCCRQSRDEILLKAFKFSLRTCTHHWDITLCDVLGCDLKGPSLFDFLGFSFLFLHKQHELQLDCAMYHE